MTLTEEKTPKIAILAGSFDPLTYGHLDLIERGVKIFDQLIVGVFTNLKKTSLLSEPEKVALINQVIKPIPRVIVQSFTNQLIADVAKETQASFLLRGIRNLRDYEDEQVNAYFNFQLSSEKLETVFLLADPKYQFISSSSVKEALQLGADLTPFVPREIAIYLQARCDHKRGDFNER